MRHLFALSFLTFSALITNAAPTSASCQAQSGANPLPVLELYTSEGCSSCPPADRWLSALSSVHEGKALALAFHVDYWDYIGWRDRFASPLYTKRQYEGAKLRGSRQVYTPQVVLNGKDFSWASASSTNINTSAADKLAPIKITLTGAPSSEGFVLDATIQAHSNAGLPVRLAAYFAITEDGHSSRVSAGENARETLKHDYVVTQYQPVPPFSLSAEPLQLHFSAASISSITPNRNTAHKQRAHLIVTDAATGAPVQALSLDACL